MSRRILKEVPKKEHFTLTVYLRILIGFLNGSCRMVPMVSNENADLQIRETFRTYNKPHHEPAGSSGSRFVKEQKPMDSYYEFQSSAKILSGSNALENIPSELENLNVKRPILLSDGVLSKIGTLQIVEEALNVGGIEPAYIVTDIPPIPPLR